MGICQVKTKLKKSIQLNELKLKTISSTKVFQQAQNLASHVSRLMSRILHLMSQISYLYEQQYQRRAQFSQQTDLQTGLECCESNLWFLFFQNITKAFSMGFAHEYFF
ncbi:hypothetical protein FGO68_gene15113 [Halteria grandinella]|uniref:Uncharacterized protein n=1 Tax=Halteria grandinella TaxID=5974 RepID=A0A8J8NAY4_HALGN|nr:hypothetical protein FGO68_gene15113 [Halteria grandinella]